MKTTETQQWFHLLMFTIAGIAFFGVLYVLSAVFIKPAEDVRDYYAGVIYFLEEDLGQAPAVVPPPGEVYADFFALKTNQTVAIGNYRVIYRGLETRGRFKLEVADTRLDSKTFYANSFAIRDATTGIRIGDRQFSVLSARPTILHLRRINP